MDDLDVKSKLDYLKKDFNIFYAKEASPKVATVIWDKEKDWKEFFEIAKKEGVRTIVAELLTLPKEGLDLNRMSEEDDVTLNEDLVRQYKPELNKFSKFTDKLGTYRLSWIKDGVRYVLSESTDWFEEYAKLLMTINSYANNQNGIRRIGGEQLDAPPELKKKSEEELVDEMIEFIKEELPTPDRHGFYQIRELFWSKKGVSSRFGISAEFRFKMSKVEMLVEKRIEEAQAAEEKEKLPDLIDECIDWCKDNGLKKVTKTNVKAFLAEKEANLSRNSEDILYQKVNFKLKEIE
jgi:hypothetical protein